MRLYIVVDTYDDGYFLSLSSFPRAREKFFVVRDGSEHLWLPGIGTVIGWPRCSAASARRAVAAGGHRGWYKLHPFHHLHRQRITWKLSLTFFGLWILSLKRPLAESRPLGWTSHDLMRKMRPWRLGCTKSGFTLLGPQSFLILTWTKGQMILCFGDWAARRGHLNRSVVVAAWLKEPAESLLGYGRHRVKQRRGNTERFGFLFV